MSDKPRYVKVTADDLRAVLDKGPSDPVTGCRLCGNRSVCHYCEPQMAARYRLLDAANAR